MTDSPSTFDGSLDRLVGEFVLPNLPSAEIVSSYHQLLADYCRSKNPLCLIRYMRGTERGAIYATADGDRFKATDNAPAWWMHHALFHEIEISAEAFPVVIATMPTHMFEVGAHLKQSINSAGWHVAHIVNVKDSNVNFTSWSREELVARFLRNVHPCNCFFIPKPDWQRWGADERVISFFASLYAERYRDVWGEFLSMSRADLARLPPAIGSIRYHYFTSSSRRTKRIPAVDAPDPIVEGSDDVGEGDVRLVLYSASRLLFKAEVIDGLRNHDRFRVVTPAGSYEMSKADFLRVFNRITLTRSYREMRVYHYPKAPAIAAQFLVKE